VDGEVLCIHGGLSPDVKTLDQVRVLARAQEPPLEGAFCGKLGPRLFYDQPFTPNADLLWSDPTDKTPTWLRSGRNCGYLFGNAVTDQVCLEVLPIVRHLDPD
jgi:diadenosine tetraphosphatase ApaH/serine/threonine PP2A family protein phosphatase